MDSQQFKLKLKDAEIMLDQNDIQYVPILQDQDPTETFCIDVTYKDFIENLTYRKILKGYVPSWKAAEILNYNIIDYIRGIEHFTMSQISSLVKNPEYHKLIIHNGSNTIKEHLRRYLSQQVLKPFGLCISDLGKEDIVHIDVNHSRTVNHGKEHSSNRALITNTENKVRQYEIRINVEHIEMYTMECPIIFTKTVRSQLKRFRLIYVSNEIYKHPFTFKFTPQIYQLKNIQQFRDIGKILDDINNDNTLKAYRGMIIQEMGQLDYTLNVFFNYLPKIEQFSQYINEFVNKMNQCTQNSNAMNEIPGIKLVISKLDKQENDKTRELIRTCKDSYVIFMQEFEQYIIEEARYVQLLHNSSSIDLSDMPLLDKVILDGNIIFNRSHLNTIKKIKVVNNHVMGINIECKELDDDKTFFNINDELMYE